MAKGKKNDKLTVSPDTEVEIKEEETKEVEPQEIEIKENKKQVKQEDQQIYDEVLAECGNNHEHRHRDYR